MSTDDLPISRPMVPAQPGFFLIEIPCDEAMEECPPGDFFRQPILAWRADEYGSLDPVVCDDDGDRRAYFILCPDGQVIHPHNSSWDDFESFEQAKREEARKRLADLDFDFG
jgi:hypothetical protein